MAQGQRKPVSALWEPPRLQPVSTYDLFPHSSGSLRSLRCPPSKLQGRWVLDIVCGPWQPVQMGWGPGLSHPLPSLWAAAGTFQFGAFDLHPTSHLLTVAVACFPLVCFFNPPHPYLPYSNSSLFIVPMVHLFRQHIHIECLLCARHWDTARDK